MGPNTIHLPAFLIATDAGSIPLVMLIVFGITKLAAEFFEALRQIYIVGEIVAGIAIGPSVLNWVQPGELLTALAELGVMFLLFRVGLEVKAADLVEAGRTATAVAIPGVLVPFGLGWIKCERLNKRSPSGFIFVRVDSTTENRCTEAIVNHGKELKIAGAIFRGLEGYAIFSLRSAAKVLRI